MQHLSSAECSFSNIISLTFMLGGAFLYLHSQACGPSPQPAFWCPSSIQLASACPISRPWGGQTGSGSSPHLGRWSINPMTCHLKHETAGPQASCGHRHKYGGNQQFCPLSIPHPAALRRLGASENNWAEPLISLTRKLGSGQWSLRGHPRVWILCFWKSETRLSTINTGTKNRQQTPQAGL